MSQEFGWLDLTPVTATRESHSFRPIRAMCAMILVVGAVAASLSGCSSASSVDGNYIKIAETSGISSAWIVEGDSIQYVNGSCSQYDLDHEPAVLSEDRTRITDPATGENTYSPSTTTARVSSGRVTGTSSATIRRSARVRLNGGKPRVA
ncbi:hypothetical protein [Microbacterium paraoxydans]|uniref:hypothetical protein n=1 Tax=Microbacterium paraoxydans TaxID=199592 RepID=UPI001CFA9E28|nr:hypothetical protein [Microbacterium paraoxydans]